MKKWALLFALLPVAAVAAQDAVLMENGIYADAQYRLEDYFCLDGSVPKNAQFQTPGKAGLVFSENGKLTIQVQIDTGNSVDVKYWTKRSGYMIAGNPAGGANRTFTYRVRDRNLTLIQHIDPNCPGHGRSILQFFTNGQNVNNPVSNSLNTGFPYDLNWALGAQLNDEMGYKISYVGFKTAEPTITAIDQTSLEARDGITMIRKLADRASRCLDVQIDDAAKTITVKPRSLVYVDSKHIENSTYSVDGGEPFTLETNNEHRERYFCIIRPDLIEAEWQKKAFAEYLKGPYFPSIMHR
jgi:hypothetical protein